MRISYWSSDVCSSDLGLEEIFSIGRAGGGPYLIVSCIPPAIAQVVACRRGKYHRFLRHDRHMGTNVGRICPTQINAVKAYSPFGRIVEALSKLQQRRSEEHTSELQSLMRISYAVFCLKKN